MKKYKDFGVYDFSDYAEEITGDALFKINGGSSSCNGEGPASGGNGSSTNSGSNNVPTGNSDGPAVIPTTCGSDSNGANPETPSGSTQTSSEYHGVPPQYWVTLDEQKEKREEEKLLDGNAYAYSYYKALQGQASSDKNPGKYKGYNVLGVGNIKGEVKPIMGEHVYSEYFINKYVPEQYRADALKALQLEEMQGLYGAPTDSIRVTTKIGVKTSLQYFHSGVDIGAVKTGKKGDPIYATADGEVLRNSKTKNSGSTILELSLPYTKDTAIYQHAQFIVNEGDTVKRGQIIGYMSDEGTAGQVHLHYEIRKDGIYGGPGGTGELINPLQHMPSSYIKK